MQVWFVCMYPHIRQAKKIRTSSLMTYSVLDGINVDDLMLIEGDLKARMGCGQRSDPWVRT